ncbi:MAG: hypothetical protein EBS21_09045 [Sphingomonadaceae bacterium]|nr:hypothetical protein [Sphingomonadaceae bacterium]
MSKSRQTHLEGRVLSVTASFLALTLAGTGVEAEPVAQDVSSLPADAPTHVILPSALPMRRPM